MREIQYAAPKYIGEPDPTNTLDTLVTIEDIRELNVAIEKVCKDKP